MHISIKSRYFILLSCLFILSCGTADKAYLNKETSTADENAAVSSEVAGTEIEIDKSFKIFPEAVWNMSGQNKYLYFIGISPYYLDEKKSDEILLSDASQSAAVFDSVFGFSGKITGKSSAGIKTGSSFNYIFDSNSYEYYKINLEEEATYRDNGSIYRIYRLENSFEFPSVEKSEKNKTPGWINSLPEIEGYMFSIGVSGRYSRIADSVKNADSAALEAMIKQKNITVYSDTGYNNLNPQSYEYASSGLKGFYILRRWWSSDRRNYYSLGVIKENRQKAE